LPFYRRCRSRCRAFLGSPLPDRAARGRRGASRNEQVDERHPSGSFGQRRINMRKLIVFNHVTLDGYFVDSNGDMSWAHNNMNDPEYKAFVEGNASGEGELLFGRVTYELMAS